MKYILDHKLRNVLSEFSDNKLVQIQEYGFGVGIKKDNDFAVPVFETIDEVAAYYVDRDNEVFEVYQEINDSILRGVSSENWENAVKIGYERFLEKQQKQRTELFDVAIDAQTEEIYCVKQAFTKKSQGIKTDNYYFFTTNKDLASFAEDNVKRLSIYPKKYSRVEIEHLSELINRLQMQ